MPTIMKQKLAQNKQISLFGLILTLLLLHLLPFKSDFNALLMQNIFDAGHFFIFSIFSFALTIITNLNHKDKNYFLNKFRILTLVLLSIFFLEGIQPYFERSGSLGDIIHGAIGAITGTYAIDFYQRSKIGFCSFVLFASIASFLPAIEIAYALFQAKERFPIIFDFDKDYEKHFIKTISPLEKISLNLANSKIEIETEPNLWSGIELYPTLNNWQGYKNLEIYLSAEENIELGLRIDDNQNCEDFYQRFNKKLNLSKKENIIVVPIKEIEESPKDRKLKINAISRIMIFANSKDKIRFSIEKINLT